MGDADGAELEGEAVGDIVGDVVGDVVGDTESSQRMPQHDVAQFVKISSSTLAVS